MNFTLNATKVLQIINSEYGDPHTILGMHKIQNKGLYARAFIPYAKKIFLIPIDNKKNKIYELKKIHLDGFFEGKIDEKEWFEYKFKIELENNHNLEIIDPYSFTPSISDFDMHLFSKGVHYKIFEKLGANFTKINGIEGVSFAVWAPNAKRVSVIGCFNNYDGRIHQMRILQNSGIWEIFIPNLKSFFKYKFEIKTAENKLIEKADPFAKFSELRPSSNSILYKSQFEWQDDDWIKKRSSESPLLGPLNIYEINLSSWRQPKEKDFYNYVELAHMIVPYIIEMGYTHIELMPILEYPFDGSWGYQVTGYFSPTSRYGNPDEFKYFVNFLHKNGIGIILDWVPAHFPKDSHGLSKFDGSSLFEHENPKQSEHPEWGTYIFNYGRLEVQNFLIASALYWIEEYHIDGLRVDAVSSMIYLNYAKYDGNWIPNKYGGNYNIDAIEFIKHMNSIISSQNPNVLMIAEESTSYPNITHPLENRGLGFNLKWNMGWMNDFLNYIEKETIYRKYHHNQLNFGMMYNHKENYILVLSHDEVVHGKKSLLNKMPGDQWQQFANLRISLGFMYTHPGKKLLFMGAEFGQYIEWDEKRPLDWFLLEYPFHKGIFNFSKDLNHLYKNEEALWLYDFIDKGFNWIDADDSERSIVSFVRKSNLEYQNLIVICNFTEKVYEEFRIGLDYVSNYREILNSDSKIYEGSGITNESILIPDKHLCNNREFSIKLRLPPLAMVILKPVL